MDFTCEDLKTEMDFLNQNHKLADWKMNLLTDHYPVYDSNAYLNAEKKLRNHKIHISDCVHVYWIKSINLPLN